MLLLLLLLLLLFLPRLSVPPFLALSLVLFFLLLSLMLQELLVKDLVLPGEFLKVDSKISYLFFHRSHLGRLATGRKRLSVYLHRSRPDHAVLCIGAVKSKDVRFPTDGAN